jgi:hypothetical protein
MKKIQHVDHQLKPEASLKTVQRRSFRSRDKTKATLNECRAQFDSDRAFAHFDSLVRLGHPPDASFIAPIFRVPIHDVQLDCGITRDSDQNLNEKVSGTCTDWQIY